MAFTLDHGCLFYIFTHNSHLFHSPQSSRQDYIPQMMLLYLDRKRTMGKKLLPNRSYRTSSGISYTLSQLAIQRRCRYRDYIASDNRMWMNDKLQTILVDLVEVLAWQPISLQGLGKQRKTLSQDFRCLGRDSN